MRPKNKIIGRTKPSVDINASYVTGELAKAYTVLYIFSGSGDQTSQGNPPKMRSSSRIIGLAFVIAEVVCLAIVGSGLFYTKQFLALAKSEFTSVVPSMAVAFVRKLVTRYHDF